MYSDYILFLAIILLIVFYTLYNKRCKLIYDPAIIHPASL